MNVQIPMKDIVFVSECKNNVNGADEKTKDACTNAKADGMEVYSIALMVDQLGARQLLENCATNPSTHYFQAESASDLIAAFDAIGKKAAQSATRLTN